MHQRIKAVESRRQLAGSQTEDPRELVGPGPRVVWQIPFPASQVGKSLRLLELDVARAQGFLGAAM
jgi:hypothetical protein